MQALVLILRNTPLWVFAVFALLLWLGIVALRQRRVRLWRVLSTPLVFIVWGLVTLALGAAHNPALAADWLLTALAGGVLAFGLVRLPGLRVDRGQGWIHLPGSTLPLIRNMAIFLARYVLAVAIARAPELRPQLLWWDVAVSGISAGYFAGWLARLTLRMRQAPPQDAGAVAQEGAV